MRNQNEIEINGIKLDVILDNHKKYLDNPEVNKELKADLHYADLRNADLHYADLRNADLHGADLRNADLQYTDLQNADLRYADLQYTDLRNADLQNADLQYTDLHGADLRNADLRYTDLHYADLRNADLRYADLDYSCWPLSCKSLNTTVDKKIAVQLAFHLCSLNCDDPEFIEMRAKILDFANKFHRTEIERLK